MHLHEKAPVKTQQQQQSVTVKLQSRLGCHAKVGLNAALPPLNSDSLGWVNAFAAHTKQQLCFVLFFHSKSGSIYNELEPESFSYFCTCSEDISTTQMHAIVCVIAAAIL